MNMCLDMYCIIAVMHLDASRNRSVLTPKKLPGTRGKKTKTKTYTAYFDTIGSKQLTAVNSGQILAFPLSQTACWRRPIPAHAFITPMPLRSAYAVASQVAWKANETVTTHVQAEEHTGKTINNDKVIARSFIRSQESLISFGVGKEDVSAANWKVCLFDVGRNLMTEWGQGETQL